MVQGQFQIHFHHWSIISKISKKYEPSQYESSHSAWYEHDHQFSFEVIDIFIKVYVSVENFAVRIVHVDLDRLLFMFDERILIFLKRDSFYLLSIKTPKMAANPLKKTEIRREMTKVPAFPPFFRRYGWTLCVWEHMKKYLIPERDTCRLLITFINDIASCSMAFGVT